MITALVVNFGNMEGKAGDEKLAVQARIYKAAVEACLELKYGFGLHQNRIFNSRPKRET